DGAAITNVHSTTKYESYASFEPCVAHEPNIACARLHRCQLRQPLRPPTGEDRRTCDCNFLRKRIRGRFHPRPVPSERDVPGWPLLLLRVQGKTALCHPETSLSLGYGPGARTSTRGERPRATCSGIHSRASRILFSQSEIDEGALARRRRTQGRTRRGHCQPQAAVLPLLCGSGRRSEDGQGPAVQLARGGAVVVRNDELDLHLVQPARRRRREGSRPRNRRCIPAWDLRHLRSPISLSRQPCARWSSAGHHVGAAPHRFVSGSDSCHAPTRLQCTCHLRKD